MNLFGIVDITQPLRWRQYVPSKRRLYTFKSTRRCNPEMQHQNLDRCEVRISNLCEISNSQGGENEDYNLLRYSGM
jgi:hypothetical protein